MGFDPVCLYVEDDPISREVMELLLIQVLGFSQVFMLNDSINFIQRVKALPMRPDIIFLDIHVRPYNGFDMLAMLRHEPDYAHIPTVALTASVMNEEVQKLRSAGFNGAIAKPLDQDTFLDTISRILNGEQVWRILR